MDASARIDKYDFVEGAIGFQPDEDFALAGLGNEIQRVLDEIEEHVHEQKLCTAQLEIAVRTHSSAEMTRGSLAIAPPPALMSSISMMVLE